MLIKFLHLNIEFGNRIDKIIEFVKKEDFDILNFQEVTGGSINENDIDCFNYFKNHLSYEGDIAVSWRLKDEKKAYFGNATLFKKSFVLEDKKIIWLKEYEEVSSDLDFQYRPYSVLSLQLNNQDKTFRVVNTHLLWGPTPDDTDEKLRQGRELYEYLKKINTPFILSGDFNLDQNSQIVALISTLGRNLISEKNIANTLNPRLHRAKELFPPGLAVDYIFTSHNIEVKKFKVVEDVDLSDHLALSAEIEL